MKVTQFAILSITLAFASCSKKPTLIQGQIFVVTKGGENIKMGAVPVHVIPEESFQEIARTTVSAIGQQHALEQEHRASRQAQRQLLEELDAMKSQVLDPSALETLRNEVNEEGRIQGLEPASDKQWLEAFARVLPPTQIQTDADGRFTAEVGAKVWLVAGGQRSVGNSTERYFWVKLYEPPQQGMPQPVLISNRDNVSAKEELYAFIAPLLGKEPELWNEGTPKPSDSVVAWVAKIKAQAEKIVAEQMSKIEDAKAAFLKANGGDAIVVGPKLSMRVTFIRPGSFTMGSPENEEGRLSVPNLVNENQVEITLNQPFWLAKTEVTQAQWEAVMGSNPSHFKGPNLPVENVSWEDAQTFIAKLNEKQILPEAWKFALPTEAQWEYACRAGEKGPYSGGSLDEVGWYKDNSDSKTREVGQKKPNAWGLHDMHGNVWEWCADWHEESAKGGTDPTGPSSGDFRVFRGGSWGNAASDCRAAFRGRFSPGFRLSILGFRPALVPSR